MTLLTIINLQKSSNASEWPSPKVNSLKTITKHTCEPSKAWLDTLSDGKFSLYGDKYAYLLSHRLSCPPDSVYNHALEGSNVCWVIAFSEFTFGEGHSDAFDAFCMSKITKTGISRPIYHYTGQQQIWTKLKIWILKDFCALNLIDIFILVS